MAEEKQVWVVDDALLSALFGDDAPSSVSKKRPASVGLSKAIHLHLAGKSAEALAELSPTLPGANPAEIYSARGHIEFETGRYEDAARSYAKILEADPQNATATFNLGVCQERLQKYQDALLSFRKALELNPARAEAQLGTGICLLRTGQAQEALDWLDRYLREKPDDRTALFAKGVALQLCQKPDEATAIYEALLHNDSSFQPALVNLLGLAVARKDISGIQSASERLLKLDPNSKPAFESLAAAAFSDGDFETASKYCMEITKIAPDSFEGWLNLAIGCHGTKQLDRAMRAYEEAMKLRPDSEQALANVGNILQERGDLDGAAKSYERALQLAPERPQTSWNLAVVRELQGDGTAAERHYGQLTSRNPDWEDAWFRMGCLRLQRGEFQGSIEAFGESVKRRPTHVPSLINGALACWCMDDLGSAQEMFERALGLDPECQAALRGLAALAMHSNEPVRALTYCDTLSKIGDNTAELRYNLALLFQETGDASQAAHLYRAVLAESPEFPEALLNLGHALEMLGEREEARRCWTEAIRQKPELAAG